MKYTKLIWRDGQPYNALFDDIYYSSNEDEAVSGENEFQHVFFKHNGLPERWQTRDDFVIAELGFGSGLNCILTIRAWLKHCAEHNEEKTLHYIAIEKHPLSSESIVELISRYPELKYFCDELMASYPPAVETTHCRRLFDGRVVVHFKFMDVCDALKDSRLNVDAWYLDGFSPAKNPAMWSQEMFELIANNSRDGATCSTYTAAGFVKRNLQHAGFVVNKVSGYGKKREMLVAEMPAEHSENTATAIFRYRDKPWFELPVRNTPCSKHATIIGAGIAGLSMAYALVQRGWSVTIIDKQSRAADQASSNPAPIIYPRLSVNNDVDTEFFTMAYCYAVSLFKSLQLKSRQKFWFGDGILQLTDEKRITQIIKKFQFNSDFVAIDDVKIDKQEGQAVIKYAGAGVVLPDVLCNLIKNECADKLSVIDADITGANYDGEKWSCLREDQSIVKSEILIIANGTKINELGFSLKFPVEPIRGQVAVLKENQLSGKIKKTLNTEIHITPAINNKHYLGATYSRDNKDLNISEQDNRELLASLDKIYPDMFDEQDCCDAWVGFRAVSKDRVPIVGAVPDEAFFNEEYADIANGSTTQTYRSASYLNGLYISAAHGSRGFTSSFLAAEIIASQITGEPSPANKKILDYLNPSRFIVNDLKRR